MEQNNGPCTLPALSVRPSGRIVRHNIIYAVEVDIVYVRINRTCKRLTSESGIRNANKIGRLRENYIAVRKLVADDSKTQG